MNIEKYLWIFEKTLFSKKGYVIHYYLTHSRPHALTPSLNRIRDNLTYAIEKSLTTSLKHSPSFIHSLVYSLTHSLTHSHSFMHLRTHICSSITSLIHSRTHIHSFIHPLTYSCTHIHSFIHSLIH